MISCFRPNTFAAGALFVAIAFAPLPLGSTLPTFIAVECGLLGLAAMTLTLRGTQRAHIALLLCFAVVPIAYVVVIHEQISPHPWFSQEFPSPWWGRASGALQEALPATRSVIRDQPWFSLGAPLLASLALINSIVVCTDRIWAHRLIDWVFWVGTVYAFVGIASFVTDPSHIFSFEKYAYRDVLTGTFINRNTAAVYFGGCLVIGAVKIAVAVREGRGQPLFRLPWHVLSPVPRATLLPAALSLINLVAMLMTASRAGIVLSLLAGLISVALIFRSRLANLRSIAKASAVTVIVMGLLVVLAGSVMNRFANQGVGDEGRFEIYQAVWRSVRDHPLFGTGLGTFRWSFSPYRPDDVPIWGIWDRAHNVVLEIAAEGGLPLAAVVLATAVAITAILIRGAFVRRRDRQIPTIGLGIAVIAFAHATIDFSLQIPGYAITAFAVIGAGLAQSFRSGGSTIYRSPSNFNAKSGQ